MGGFSIDIDDILSPLVLISVLRPRAPLDSHKGQRGTRDPCAPTLGGTLSSSLPTTLPSRLAVSALQSVPSLTAVCPRLGVCVPSPPTSKVFF